MRASVNVFDFLNPEIMYLYRKKNNCTFTIFYAFDMQIHSRFMKVILKIYLTYCIPEDTDFSHFRSYYFSVYVETVDRPGFVLCHHPKVNKPRWDSFVLQK